MRLIASCAAAPPAWPQSPYAAATPMFDAAGIVVTEISTPIRAPDFALVSESIPTIPAANATVNEKTSGFEMKPVRLCVAVEKSSGASPVHL